MRLWGQSLKRMNSGVWCGPRMQELLFAMRSATRDGSSVLVVYVSDLWRSGRSVAEVEQREDA